MIDAAGASRYDELCEKYGIDPAYDLEDPFLAWQLRHGLTALREREAADRHREANPRADFDAGYARIRAAERELGVATAGMGG